MTKLRIMLLSFALLAIVGSTLAFKARFANTFFCTAPTNGALANVCTVAAGVQKFCPNTILSTYQDQGLGQLNGYWCTTTARDLDADGAADDCMVGVVSLRCTTTTQTLYADGLE